MNRPNILVHKAFVAELGCIVCRREGNGPTPAELHHPRKDVGMSQRASDWDVIPLCYLHHRKGGHGVALHAGPETFEARFGTEAELLDHVWRMLPYDRVA